MYGNMKYLRSLKNILSSVLLKKGTALVKMFMLPLDAQRLAGILLCFLFIKRTKMRSSYLHGT